MSEIESLPGDWPMWKIWLVQIAAIAFFLSIPAAIWLIGR